MHAPVCVCVLKGKAIKSGKETLYAGHEDLVTLPLLREFVENDVLKMQLNYLLQHVRLVFS